MITAMEQSVAQNPAYRLATNGALLRSAPFLLVVAVAATLHHTRRLHQTRTRHPVTRKNATQGTPDHAYRQDEYNENGYRQAEGDERMLPDSYCHGRDETE